MRTDALVVGVDVGTQGARVFVVDPTGSVLGHGSAPFESASSSEGWHEQDPLLWIEAVKRCLEEALLPLTRRHRASIVAMGVTSTSGTLVLTDAHGVPVRPAIMWNDTRAQSEAEELEIALEQFTSHTGLRMRGSFPLPKILWLSRHEPGILERAQHLMHAADFLLWHLGVHRPVTDPTNALKTGYDVTTDRWDVVLNSLGVVDKLPSVVDSGTVLGTIATDLAGALGLSSTVALVGTMTDANTSMLAAGVYSRGAWMTTLGTGLSIKGVLSEQLKDPNGSVYCHRDPRRYWLASGTSHCGAAAVSSRFGRDLNELTTRARAETPGQLIVYALSGRGDYFPFWNPEATAFTRGTGNKAAEFRSTLEGIAIVEHLAYVRLAQLGAEIGEEIVSTGGASHSRLWSEIRATVQGRSLQAVALPETAVGAAIAAYAGVGVPVEQSIASMVRYAERIDPDPALATIYRDLVGSYESALRSEGMAL